VQPEGGKLIQEQSQKLSRPASRKLGDKKAIVFTGQAFTLALLPTLLSFTVIGATEKPETTVEPELARSDSVLAVAKVWADSDILSVAALVGDRSPRKGQASYSKVALARGLTGEEEEESSEELQDKLSKAVEFAADTYKQVLKVASELRELMDYLIKEPNLTPKQRWELVEERRVSEKLVFKTGILQTQLIDLDDPLSLSSLTLDMLIPRLTSDSSFLKTAQASQDLDRVEKLKASLATTNKELKVAKVEAHKHLAKLEEVRKDAVLIAGLNESLALLRAVLVQAPGNVLKKYELTLDKVEGSFTDEAYLTLVKEVRTIREETLNYKASLQKLTALLTRAEAEGGVEVVAILLRLGIAKANLMRAQTLRAYVPLGFSAKAYLLTKVIRLAKKELGTLSKAKEVALNRQLEAKYKLIKVSNAQSTQTSSVRLQEVKSLLSKRTEQLLALKLVPQAVDGAALVDEAKARFKGVEQLATDLLEEASKCISGIEAILTGILTIQESCTQAEKSGRKKQLSETVAAMEKELEEEVVRAAARATNPEDDLSSPSSVTKLQAQVAQTITGVEVSSAQTKLKLEQALAVRLRVLTQESARAETWARTVNTIRGRRAASSARPEAQLQAAKTNTHTYVSNYFSVKLAAVAQVADAVQVAWIAVTDQQNPSTARTLADQLAAKVNEAQALAEEASSLLVTSEALQDRFELSLRPSLSEGAICALQEKASDLTLGMTTKVLQANLEVPAQVQEAHLAQATTLALAEEERARLALDTLKRQGASSDPQAVSAKVEAPIVIGGQKTPAEVALVLAQKVEIATINGQAAPGSILSRRLPFIQAQLDKQKELERETLSVKIDRISILRTLLTKSMEALDFNSADAVLRKAQVECLTDRIESMLSILKRKWIAFSTARLAAIEETILSFLSLAQSTSVARKAEIVRDYVEGVEREGLEVQAAIVHTEELGRLTELGTIEGGDLKRLLNRPASRLKQHDLREEIYRLQGRLSSELLEAEAAQARLVQEIAKKLNGHLVNFSPHATAKEKLAVIKINRIKLIKYCKRPAPWV
jgi:hypothetical protein